MQRIIRRSFTSSDRYCFMIPECQQQQLKNTQDFILKLKQIGGSSEIESLINKCQQYLIQNQVRSKQAKLQRDRFFLKTVEKQFEIYQQKDLIDLFKTCPLTLFDHQVMQNLYDTEDKSQIDKIKIQEFMEYFEQNKPEENLQELEFLKEKQLTIQKYHNQEPLQNQDIIQEQTQKLSLELDQDYQLDEKCVNDLDSSKFINITNQELYLYKRAYDQNPNSESLQYYAKKQFSKGQIQNQDNMILSQKSLFATKFQKTSQVYFCGLKFRLTEEYINQFKSSIEAQFGKIKSVQTFSYCNIHNGNIIQNPKINEDQHLSKRFRAINENISQKSQDLKETFENESNESQEKNEDSVQDQIKIDKKQIKTAKIIKRLEFKRDQEMSKSYVIIDFEEESSKQKCISHDFRLFGFQFENNQIFTDDADYKTTVVINNINWGTDIKKFVQNINKYLNQQNLSDLTLEVPKENIISTKFYLYVSCHSLQHALRLISVINQISYEGRRLKACHSYGQLRYHNQVPYEDIFTVKDQDNFKCLQNKIDQLNILDKKQKTILNQQTENIEQNFKFDIDRIENILESKNNLEEQFI